MKSFKFILVYLIICFSAKATNYYVANNGSDNNTGKSPLAPWKTLVKVNSKMNSLLPGDSVLFKRGDVFNGNLQPTKSGTNLRPIVFSVFGSGTLLPEINGVGIVSGWTNVSGNLWRAYHNNNSANDINNVFINGIQKEIGRFPNRVGSIGTPNTNGMQGYIGAPYGTFFSFSSSTINSVDFTGGLVVGRSTPYSNYNKRIISQTGDTINFPTSVTIGGLCGYAIVDHINTLDADGEWYFKKAVDSLYLYSITDPNTSNVEASNTSNTMSIYYLGYLKFINIKFTKGENNSNTSFIASVYLNGCTNIEINSCEFTYNPRNVIRINAGTGNKIINCNFYQNDGTCIATDGTKNTEIRNCTVVRNNLDFTKAAKGLNGMSTLDFRRDTSLLCTENFIDSTAYNGIYMKSQTNSVISKNVIKHWNFLFMDGGGIYTHYEHNNLLLDQNLIYDATTGGNEALTIVNNTWANQTRALYLDGSTHGVTVSNNTFAIAGNLAATFGDMQNCKILNNTIFNNNRNSPLCRYWPATDSGFTTGSQIPYNPAFKTIFKNNIFAHSNSLHQAFLLSSLNHPEHLQLSDSNFYVTPFQVYNNLSKQDTAYNVKTWAAKFNYDKNSHAAPVYISTSTYPLTERITNGNFNTNVNGWTLQGNVTHNPNGMDSGCLRMLVNTTAKSFYTSVGNITAGKKYQLSFSCYAIGGWSSSLLCRLRNGRALPTIGSVISNSAPTPYYFHKDYRNSLSMVFTATTSSTNGIIEFYSPNPPTTDSLIFIDNLSFKEISTEVNKDSLVRFEVNETAIPRVINLSGIQYVDPKWNYYNGTATVPPFGSIILINSPVSPIVNGKVYPYNEVGVCVGSTLSFSPTSSQTGGSWLWSGPNNFSSNLRNPQITNLQVTHAGQYKLNYTNSGGIVYTYYFDVSVNINPLSAPVIALNNGVLTSSVASSASYIWYLNNNYLDSTTQNTLTPLLNGSYTVKTYFNGCYSPTSNIISITTLPTKLIKFNAYNNNCEILLNWQSASETNLKEYELEYSLSLSIFTSLGIISGKGDNSSYKFNYKPETSGVVYYRLKMIDFDGSIHYSEIIVLNLTCGLVECTVCQNPSKNGEFKVFTNLKNPKFKLINTLGQTENISTVKLSNENYIIKSPLAVKGMYFLNIYGNGKVATKKVFIN